MATGFDRFQGRLPEILYVICGLMEIIHSDISITMVFVTALVACRSLLTLGFFVHGDPDLTHRRSHLALAMLVLSWCLLFATLFRTIHDTLTCVSGLIRPSDSAYCFTACPFARRTMMASYWTSTASVLINTINHMTFWALDIEDRKRQGFQQSNLGDGPTG